MPFSSLRDFLDRLEADGQLVRIAERVSTDREITEIHRRVLHAGGPALWFENVVKEDGTPSEMPVVVNLFGTVERVARGVTLDGKERRTPADMREVGELLAFLRQPEPPGGLKEALGLLPLAKTVMQMRPGSYGGILGRKAPCQEVVLEGDEVDLDRLPIQTCWPGEPAPLITWPLVVTQAGRARRARKTTTISASTACRSSAATSTLMRWLKHRGGAQQLCSAGKTPRPEPLPAAAVLGADPGTILAAVTPVPDTLSEYQFAGHPPWAKAVDLVPCKTRSPFRCRPNGRNRPRRPCAALMTMATKAPMAITPATTTRSSPFRCLTISAITMRREPDLPLTTYHRPAARRAQRSWARR